jgi:hypothetical protein
MRVLDALNHEKQLELRLHKLRAELNAEEAKMNAGTPPQESEETRGTMECPICGVAEPHSHSTEEVERERQSRPTFEKFFGATLVSRHEGLDPAGTYGWSLFWQTRAKSHRQDYHCPQVEVAWRIWQEAWKTGRDWSKSNG